MKPGASIWHWAVVGVALTLLFGRGKLSELITDVAAGLRAFRTGDLREVERLRVAQAERDRELRAGEWRLWLVIAGLSVLLIVELAARFIRD
ncbi:twin-arginine translocase TatA/TatE family subunit [Terrarubrum flagellatum]|uniref:twin-arginine translocase TatA/TatE family subunit n=1 Tax=Terrirubrum flagellatum TaxID=2895980 RepID=UPI003144FF87